MACQQCGAPGGVCVHTAHQTQTQGYTGFAPPENMPPKPPAPPENLTITLELPRIGKHRFAYRYEWVKNGGWVWIHADQLGRAHFDHHGWQHLLNGIAESERRYVRSVIDSAAANFSVQIRSCYAALGEALSEIDPDTKALAEESAWLTRHAEALAEIETWAVGL